MTIDELIEGAAMPTLQAMRKCLEEFLIDREEACPPEIRLQARKCFDFQLRDFDDLVGMVYARRDECGPIMLQIAAGVSTAFSVGNFMGKREASDRISLILKRDAGVKPPAGFKFPAKKDDPDPDPRFVVTEEKQKAE